MTRREKILLLVDSIDDYRPMPRGSLRTLPGLAPTTRRPCPDCAHTPTPGQVVDRFKRTTPCETCGGRQAAPGIRAKKGRGTITVDRMDAELAPLGTEHDTPTRRPVMALCDKCGGTGTGPPHLDREGREYRDPCPPCDGIGRRARPTPTAPPPERIDDDTFKETSIDLRGSLGSYHELDVALSWLRTRSPRGWRAVLSGEDSPVRDRALRMLEARMPVQIRVPPDVVAAARGLRSRRARAVGRGSGRMLLAKRDGEIRVLVRSGKPVQWVAAEYGLSVRRVNEILAGEVRAA